jgi:hypothetical protein
VVGKKKNAQKKDFLDEAGFLRDELGFDRG